MFSLSIYVYELWKLTMAKKWNKNLANIGKILITSAVQKLRDTVD